MEWKKAVKDVRAGLPYAAVEILQQRAHLSFEQMAQILGIPKRTLQRRRGKCLTPNESDRLDRASRTFDLVASVMKEANAWWQQPNQSLGGETPISLLDTDVGLREVEEAAQRILLVATT